MKGIKGEVYLQIKKAGGPLTFRDIFERIELKFFKGKGVNKDEVVRAITDLICEEKII